jgi:hypothetical protein
MIGTRQTIDRDGVEENDDPDGWPIDRPLMGPSGDAEVNRWLAAACWEADDAD